MHGKQIWRAQKQFIRRSNKICFLCAQVALQEQPVTTLAELSRPLLSTVVSNHGNGKVVRLWEQQVKLPEDQAKLRMRPEIQMSRSRNIADLGLRSNMYFVAHRQICRNNSLPTPTPLDPTETFSDKRLKTEEQMGAPDIQLAAQSF